MQTIFGQKTDQLQRFLEDGRRVPVTVLRVPEITITQRKTREADGYTAIQVGFGNTKASKLSKPVAGHLKKSGDKTPLFLREIRLGDEGELPEVGTTLNVAEILEPGDIVWVTGTSKGKGFAGGVKRYGFRGGPRTHGQSDRERAPGSIGQTTTPGRVYKGKRMAGNMGNDQVTVKNLLVVSVNAEENIVLVAGLVPGILGSFVKVEKKGMKKKFMPLLPNAVEQAKLDAEAAKAEAEAAAAAKQAEEEAAKGAAAPQTTDETPAETVVEPAAATEASTEETATPAAAPVDEAVAEVQAEEVETDTAPTEASQTGAADEKKEEK